jgi:hypothetical protein
MATPIRRETHFEGTATKTPTLPEEDCADPFPEQSCWLRGPGDSKKNRGVLAIFDFVTVITFNQF